MTNTKVNSRSIYLEVVYRKIVRDTEIMSAVKGSRSDGKYWHDRQIEEKWQF